MSEGAAQKTDGEAIVAMMAEVIPAVPKWFPVGKTLDEWYAAVKVLRPDGLHDGPTHQDTLLVRADGAVFLCGLVGAMFCGIKMPDGSINQPPSFVQLLWKHDDVVVEAADPADYGFGCHRMENGAIHCQCPEP